MYCQSPLCKKPRCKLWTLELSGVCAWWIHLVPGGGPTLILQGEDMEALPLGSTCLFLWLVLTWVLSEKTLIISRVMSWVPF